MKTTSELKRIIIRTLENTYGFAPIAKQVKITKTHHEQSIVEFDVGCWSYVCFKVIDGDFWSIQKQ